MTLQTCFLPRAVRPAMLSLSASLQRKKETKQGMAWAWWLTVWILSVVPTLGQGGAHRHPRALMKQSQPPLLKK